MKIMNYEIKEATIETYIQHFDKSKKDLWDWERKRKELHEAIFKEAGIDRHSSEGQEFSRALDKHCIPKIEKLDYFAADLKRISSAKNEDEIAEAERQIRNKQMFAALQRRKQKQAQEKKRLEEENGNTCRRCNKELIEGVGRVNDHLSQMAAPHDEEIPTRAICSKCSEYNPDTYHEEFRKKFWGH